MNFILGSSNEASPLGLHYGDPHLRTCLHKLIMDMIHSMPYLYKYILYSLRTFTFSATGKQPVVGLLVWQLPCWVGFATAL